MAKRKAKSKAASCCDPSPTSDEKWEAESDARTLADAATISADKPRVRRAATAAKRLASEQQAQATAMTNVAKRKTGKK